MDKLFKAGDVVRLKSGGPKMTVVEYGKYGYADDEKCKCTWFDDKKKLTEGAFPEALLEAVDSSPVSFIVG